MVMLGIVETLGNSNNSLVSPIEQLQADDLNKRASGEHPESPNITRSAHIAQIAPQAAKYLANDGNRAKYRSYHAKLHLLNSFS